MKTTTTKTSIAEAAAALTTASAKTKRYPRRLTRFQRNIFLPLKSQSGDRSALPIHNFEPDKKL